MTTSNHKSKAYYTRVEVAEIIDEAPSTVKYWVNYFGLPALSSSKGRNRYHASTLEQLQTIKHLLRDKQLTLEGAKQLLETPSQADTTAQIAQELHAVRKELEELRQALDRYTMQTAAKPFRDTLQNSPEREEQ